MTSPHQRIRQKYWVEETQFVSLKLWAGACEYHTKGTQTTTLTYLSGPGGLYALHLINPDESESICYIHTDHLGSWTAISDDTGTIINEQSYDAWGNRRNDSTWTNVGELQPPLFDRGFTGHEHLDGFQLINMNGRMYDPVVSRMLAPDNFVQTPDFSQNFNRYSYALNNPLKYTDPDGEIIIPILIGAGIGMLTNGISNSVNNRPFFENAGEAALIGGMSGAFSFGIGEAVMGMSGFGKVAFKTLAHGHLGGVMSGINGETYGQGFLSGAAGSLIGNGANSLLQNAGTAMQAVGTVASGAIAGGVGAEIMGGNFWDGARNGAISAGLNTAYHTVETAVLTNQLEKVFANYPEAVDKDGNLVEISAREAFSRVSPAAEKAHLSGDVNYRNACATRLSLAFAKAGVRLPNGYGGLRDVNGNRIIISASQMNRFMSTKYGSLMSEYSGQTKGIYIGITKPGMGYSGHVTIRRPGFESYTYSGSMKTMNFWSIQ